MPPNYPFNCYSEDDKHESSTSLTKGTSTTDATAGNEIGSARMSWYGVCIVMLSDVMGTGVLGLPFVATTLGWATTMISIPLFACFAAYSGYQLKTVKVENPQFESFSDAGSELVGPLFATFTKVCMLVNWGMLAIYFLIATADGIAAVYDQGFLSCSVNRTVVAALLLIIPTQCRDFTSISKYLSFPSFFAIVIVIILIVVTMTEEDLTEDDTTNFGDHTMTGLLPGISVFDFIQSLSSMVFAFQGQDIFMEFMSEMKHPEDFTKSTNVAYFIMCTVYSFTVVIAYGIEGQSVSDFLPDGVALGPIKTTIGVLIVFHIVVAYVIAIQPFHFWVHSIVFPKTFNSSSWMGSIHWAIVTMGYILFAWVVGNLIPFFGGLQALIGSLLGAPIIFGWPSLYYLLTIRRQCRSWSQALYSIGIINSSISLLNICILTPLFCVIGTWGSIEAIILDFREAGAPFEC